MEPLASFVPAALAAPAGARRAEGRVTPTTSGRVPRSVVRVRVPVGTSLLDAARRAGLPVASACGGAGVCGRCGLRVLAGRGALLAETGAETRAKARNRIEPAVRLACRVDVTADVTVTAAYW